MHQTTSSQFASRYFVRLDSYKITPPPVFLFGLHNTCHNRLTPIQHYDKPIIILFLHMIKLYMMCGELTASGLAPEQMLNW